MNRKILITTVAMAALLTANSAWAMIVGTMDDVSPGQEAVSDASTRGAMIEAHCHRFKFMAGHAVANIEAAHEVLDAEFAAFDPLGMEVRLSDYAEGADGLRGIIEDSCGAATLDEAKVHVAVFRAEAERIREQFAGVQALMRGDIERYVSEHQERIRAAFERELTAEVEGLEREARARLESQLRAEAESRKNQMISRIQKAVEAELIAEYGGQENPDIPYLMRIGEERGRTRGEAQSKAIEAELRVKYDALAEAETEKLKAAAEERAKEKEAELRKLLDGLGGVGEKITAEAERKFAEEWAAYGDRADEAGRQVYRAFVEEEFARARNLILAEGDLVESVPQEMRDRYGLRTTRDLLDELARDEREVLAKLAGVTDVSDERIRAFREEFSKKWAELREKLDTLKARSPGIVLQQIERALERQPGAASGRVETYLAITEGAMTDRRETLERIGRYCATDAKYAASNCGMCRSLEELREMSDYGIRAAEKIRECSAIIGEFDAKKAAADAGTLSVQDAMAYGNRMRLCLEDLRAMRGPYLEFKAVYEKVLTRQQRACRK